MSRIGIFGGTFDPIHHGHLITALSVRELRNLDKIIFVPSFISPHKKEISASLPEHRLKMLRLALDDISYFSCSDYEISKKKVSYTIDTIIEMKKHYKEIELIVGADNILTFDQWKSPDKIIRLVTLVVLNRKIEDENESTNKFMKEAIFLETPRIDISGTIIRERIKKGLPIDFLVPQKVMKYIYNLKLYKE